MIRKWVESNKWEESGEKLGIFLWKVSNYCSMFSRNQELKCKVGGKYSGILLEPMMRNNRMILLGASKR